MSCIMKLENRQKLYNRFKAKMYGFALLVLMLALQPYNAFATNSPTKPAAQTPAPELPLPPYEKEMVRLAYVMGAMSYLHTLCAEPDAHLWAGRMQALLDAEAATSTVSPAWKARLAGAYNQGVQEVMLTYRVCTPSAKMLALRHSQEGAALSRALERKFSG